MLRLTWVKGLIVLLPLFQTDTGHTICHNLPIHHNFTICHTFICIDITICHTFATSLTWFMFKVLLGKISMNVEIWKQDKKRDHVANKGVLHPQRVVALHVKWHNTMTHKNTKLCLKKEVIKQTTVTCSFFKNVKVQCTKVLVKCLCIYSYTGLFWDTKKFHHVCTHKTFKHTYWLKYRQHAHCNLTFIVVQPCYCFFYSHLFNWYWIFLVLKLIKKDTFVVYELKNAQEKNSPTETVLDVFSTKDTSLNEVWPTFHSTCTWWHAPRSWSLHLKML